MKIAVLMTVHNRKETTLRCLRRLNSPLDVFLVDDGSTDGTAEAVGELFGRSDCPVEGRVIRGDGSLYWAKGMELAWKSAREHLDYDGYLWLNDDVELMRMPEFRDDCIQVGECVNAKGEATYGLRGDLFTGNFVFVPRAAYERLGMICGEYAHAWADSDYALRAKRMGVKVVSCGVVGTCEGHPNRPSLKGLALRRRWEMLFDPKGWCLHDLWLYRKRNWGLCAAIWSCAHLILHIVIGDR